MYKKERYIQCLFDSIANYYDMANTVLSFGRDRYWRQFTAKKIKEYAPKKILDLCAGTGKLSLAIAREIDGCQLIGIDFSSKMLKQGQTQLLTDPVGKQIQLQLGNAMQLDFSDNSFDCAVLGFSLRNVEDIYQVLGEMKRVVRPGGAVISLELSKPEIPFFKQIYFFYFYRLVPTMGRFISKEKGPYSYLPNSLTYFPDRKKLERIFERIGLVNVHSYPLTGGIVALHIGEKESK